MSVFKKWESKDGNKRVYVKLSKFEDYEIYMQAAEDDTIDVIVNNYHKQLSAEEIESIKNEIMELIHKYYDQVNEKDYKDFIVNTFSDLIRSMSF